MVQITTPSASILTSSRVKREKYTPLGAHYYKKALLWQRIKIETELFAELGFSKDSLRGYMVSTPANRIPEAVREIILRTMPDAGYCFKDPKISKLKSAA